MERYDGQGCQQAVIFVTPHECTIRDGLPPPTRCVCALRSAPRCALLLYLWCAKRSACCAREWQAALVIEGEGR